MFELNYYGISQGWSSSSLDGLYKLLRLQHGVTAYGEGEQSRSTFDRMLPLIAEDCKSRIRIRLSKKNSPIALCCDEVTYLSETFLVLYAQTLNGDSTEIDLLGFRPMKEGTKGNALANAILEVVRELGVSIEHLMENTYFLVTDGASNFRGCVNGAAAILERRGFDRMLSIHCACHRLDLVLKDSIKSGDLSVFRDVEIKVSNVCERVCVCV